MPHSQVGRFRPRAMGIMLALSVATTTVLCGTPTVHAAESFQVLMPSEAQTTAGVLSARVLPGGDNRLNFLVRGSGESTPLTARLTEVTSEGGAIAEDDTPVAEDDIPVTDWVSLSGPENLVVDVDNSIVLNLDIQVPEEAAPGDFAGGVVISSGQDSELFPFLIRVPGPRDAQLSVEQSDLTISGVSTWPFSRGRGELAMTVRNTGSLALYDSAHLHGSGVFGTTSLSTELEDAILLPGDTMSLSTAGAVSPGLDLTPVFDFEVPFTDDAGQENTYFVSAEGQAESTFSWALLATATSTLLILLAGWFLAQQRAVRKNTSE
ncbi:hypothetical protein [Corynebacterium alimapuense]|uniref:DUF916 domain-containing protein n=1 Tax=Corynebacterium alimapuense TaxID=1576874 RepID=A0A3M8K9Y7_9CORY|nr:hypothetical protein [Corynebacterium alimapuense]RNE50033.1 hypothetical protein C5L39_01295 [Corynebacterium alimapuense]